MNRDPLPYDEHSVDARFMELPELARDEAEALGAEWRAGAMSWYLPNGYEIAVEPGSDATGPQWEVFDNQGRPVTRTKSFSEAVTYCHE